jgi:hypothetical protein
MNDSHIPKTVMGESFGEEASWESLQVEGMMLLGGNAIICSRYGIGRQQ